ncbi:MAG: PPC domain-containing protein, partial [Sulfurovum sp.]|nr:PPC domain-containing protein [Sulfurovum sp.]
AQGSFTLVGDDNSGLNRNFKFSQNVTAGTYYVKVRHHSFSSGLGRYSLVVNFILPSSDNRGHSRDTAIPISRNSTTSGNIKLPGDSNYYKIVIPSAGKLTIYTTGSTDTLGYFLNASGGRIALDDDAGSYSNFNIEERVTAGTYYVKVQHNSSGGTGRYSLVVNFTLQRSDDHGNSMNAATTTRLNGRISGSIEVAGDEDWFKVVMPRTGILMIQTLGQTDTVGYLYNADGSQITADNNGGSGHNFLIIRSVAAGTYYVRVRHQSPSGIGTYWLDISLESDHGGYVYTATAINPNSTTPGRLQVARDNDYFRIGIPSTGTLVVHTTGPTDTVGYLLNANWDQIALDDNGGSGRNFRISKRVTAGTYYIKVKLHTSAATGPYSLISRFTPTQGDQTQGIDNSTSRGSTSRGSASRGSASRGSGNIGPADRNHNIGR